MAQPAPVVSRIVRPTEAVVAAPNYVQVAKKNEEIVLSKIEQNPIYSFIIDGEDIPKEARVAKVVQYLTAGLADGTAKVEDLDQRRAALTEFNTFVQVIRKQLGSQQAKEITSKAYADFQRIVNETTADVGRFQEELAPLGQLADLFTKYGADGNIIEKINLAKDQKKARERAMARWKDAQDRQIEIDQEAIDDLETDIASDQAALSSAWFGKGAIQARITAHSTALIEAREKLKLTKESTPGVEITAPPGEIEQVDEGVLELQNIGGVAFKKAVAELRDHTEEALAKISANFDEAITGLTNTRASFITMDRNCSDANFALSVLENAVQAAEAQSRAVSDSIIKIDGEAVNNPMAELDRMERERRSQTLLTYSASLTTFLKDVGVAVGSLRSGQAVIQNILRMNSLALESANTHKVTGIANTADAVTIIIGSIIEVCNRAASQALADGLNKMRTLAEEGSARLAGGTYESLKMQNEQLEAFVLSVADLKNMTRDITANSIGLLTEQFQIVNRMREESNQLAASSIDAQRSSFAARAGGIDDQKQPDAPATMEHRVAGLRVRETS